MASVTCCGTVPPLSTTDARSMLDLRHLPFVGEPSKKSFYVKNIPSHWDDWQLFHVFRQFGLVNNVILPDMKITHSENAYRYGFVEMLSLAGADNVLQKLGDNGSLFINGLHNPLQVQRTAPKVKSPIPFRELQFDALHNENLALRKGKDLVVVKNEKSIYIQTSRKVIHYTKAELLKIRQNMTAFAVPNVAIREILL